MSFSQNFSVAQSALNPALVTIEDTSTGSDAAIASRRVYIQDANGVYLVEDGTTTDYEPWALVDTEITLDVLSEDVGAAVTVQWLSAANAVLYSLSTNYPLAEYNKQFFYSLAQYLANNPSIMQDTVFMSNMANFWTAVQGGINAVQTGDDIAACQNLFNVATNLRNNESFAF